MICSAGVAKGWTDYGSLQAGLKTIDFVLMRNIALSWIVTIVAISRVIVIAPF